jgi:hypothetical protein
VSRFFLAFSAFFSILFDAAFAKKVELAKSGEALLPESLPAPKPVAVEVAKAAPPPMREAGPDAALQLLAILQREGRFLDFLEEDVSSFNDADIGAAARVVHTGCKKALREHITIAQVRSESEEARVTLAPGFNASEVRVTGNVVGAPPFTGTLRHRGWRAVDVKLPQMAQGHDAKILAPAEVEL